MGTGETGGIYQRNDVSFNKIRTVRKPGALVAKPVLQGGQGTDPAAKLHRRSPDGGGNMKPCPPTVPDDKETAADDKQDEEKMDDYDNIREERKRHDS